MVKYHFTMAISSLGFCNFAVKTPRAARLPKAGILNAPGELVDQDDEDQGDD